MTSDHATGASNNRENAWESSDVYNRLFLSNTPDIAFMLDHEMRFALGSEKAAAFFGYGDTREMAGIPLPALLSKVVDDDWITAMADRCDSVFSTHFPVAYEDKVTLKNAETFVFRVAITPAAEGSGECRGVVVTIHDITEIKLEESDLEKRLDQQSLLTALSQNFILSENVGALITRALKITGEYMNVSRVQIMRYVNQSFDYQFEWLNPSSSAKTVLNTVLPIADSQARIADAFLKKLITHFYPSEADLERFRQVYGLDDKTFAMFPLYLPLLISALNGC